MLTHIDKKGNAKMVDISSKKITSRIAEARGTIHVTRKILENILSDLNKKGDVLTVAKIAGIQACKKTSDLIPLCHNIGLDSINIDFEILKEDCEINCYVSVKCNESTGAEMEALTAASISLLTIYDMCKGVDKGMEIKNICLIKKSGGKSGEWSKSSNN